MELQSGVGGAVARSIIGLHYRLAQLRTQVEVIRTFGHSSVAAAALRRLAMVPLFPAQWTMYQARSSALGIDQMGSTWALASLECGATARLLSGGR